MIDEDEVIRANRGLILLTLNYRITRMFCEHQTFANFVRVDQFPTIKSALLLVNAHDPCQNAIVRSQRVNFSADLAHSQRFFTRKITVFNNLIVDA